MSDPRSARPASSWQRTAAVPVGYARVATGCSFILASTADEFVSTFRRYCSVPTSQRRTSRHLGTLDPVVAYLARRTVRRDRLIRR